MDRRRHGPGRRIFRVDEKLENLMAEILQVSPTAIRDHLTMRNLDAWDSLKHMELVVSLERCFGIELGFEDIVAMQSVGEIKRILRERGAR